MNNNIWEIVIAVCTALQAIAVVIAIVYAAKELRSVANDRHLALVFNLHEMFSDPKAKAARYHIFNKLPTDPAKLTREDYEMARDTWNLMDQIGIVFHYNLASRQMILELYSRQIARLWHQLEPHILHYRRIRGSFAMYFQELAEVSLAYRQKHFEEEKPYLYPSVVDHLSANAEKSEVEDEG